MNGKSLLGLSTLDVLRFLVRKNESIKQLILREYVYPKMPLGSKPALGDKLKRITREKFLADDFFIEYCKKLDKNKNIGIESLVGLEHIPMMDMCFKKSEKELENFVEKWNRTITPRFGRGVVIETDNSYHFIGIEKLLKKNELKEFLAWSLLCVEGETEGVFKCYVDVQYVAYSLLKQSLCLRITSYPDTNYLPKVIYEF